MNRRERKLLEDIYRHCLALRKHGELTEFGSGQMVLCGLLRGSKDGL